MTPERRADDERRHKVRHALNAMSETEERVFRTYNHFFNLLVAFHQDGTDLARAASMLTLAEKLEAIRDTLPRKPL